MFKPHKLAIMVTALLGLYGCNTNDETTDNGRPDNALQVLQYVDPLIGTDGLGNVNPAPVMPEGMIQPGPAMSSAAHQRLRLCAVFSGRKRR